MSRQRIGAQELANHLRQAVEALAHVGVPSAKKDANRQRQAQHEGASKTARRRRKVSASKPAGTRTTRPGPATTSNAAAVAIVVTRTGTKAGSFAPRCWSRSAMVRFHP